jgi:hypothetical protein
LGNSSERFHESSFESATVFAAASGSARNLSAHTGAGAARPPPQTAHSPSCGRCCQATSRPSQSQQRPLRRHRLLHLAANASAIAGRAAACDTIIVFADHVAVHESVVCPSRSRRLPAFESVIGGIAAAQARLLARQLMTRSRPHRGRLPRSIKRDTAFCAALKQTAAGCHRATAVAAVFACQSGFVPCRSIRTFQERRPQSTIAA